MAAPSGLIMYWLISCGEPSIKTISSIKAIDGAAFPNKTLKPPSVIAISPSNEDEAP